MKRCAFVALILLALTPPGAAALAPETHLAAAVRLVGEGDFRGALAEARLERAQPDASQALLHVWHQAGALEEALAAGLAGLETRPADTWLLDRCAYLAISLGEGDLALELCNRLREVTDESAWERSSWMLAEAEVLVVQGRERAGGLRRARWTVLLSAVAALCAALWLARSK